MPRAFSAITLPLAAAALAAGCGGKAPRAQAEDVRAALTTYLHKAPPDVSDIARDGRVTRVSCSPGGERYRHARVFDCTISHVSGTTVEWCVALVDRRLVTQNEDPGIPCARLSPPSMEGPQ